MPLNAAARSPRVPSSLAACTKCPCDSWSGRRGLSSLVPTAGVEFIPPGEASLTLALRAACPPAGLLECGHLPQQTPFVEAGPKAALLNRSQDQLRLVRENSELHPDHSKPEVDECQTKPRPPSVVWEAHHKEAPSALGRGTDQLWHVWIAAMTRFMTTMSAASISEPA